MNYISKILKKIIYSTTSLRKVCSSKPWSTKKIKMNCINVINRNLYSILIETLTPSQGFFFFKRKNINKRLMLSTS